MAEVAASLATEKLTSLLSEDVELLRGVHEEVEDIKLELEFITCFLKEADAMAARDQGSTSIITWVKLVRETAFRIEDAIDGYMTSSISMSNVTTHEIASELRDIRISVREIGQKRRRYGLNMPGNTGVARRDPRVGLQFVQDNELVGIVSPRSELVHRLISGPSVSTVVSLVGMGGIGKTTLARKVYENQTVDHHHNLVRIGLHWSRIFDDSLKILGVVPNLLKFQLTNGYDGAQLHFEKGYFQRLEELAFRMLNGLNRLTIDEGAFPSLEWLSIGPCPYLQELPWTISCLKSLKPLAFHNMPNSFALKLVPDEGADHWKVEHIPNVVFCSTNGSMQCYVYRLGDQRLLQVLHCT
ncbi:hypothetical protein F3Y22_tig00112259pilonHSYRG00067 [Hibiscus syriacus]|uniref:Uncharacterized protein n=1 Tax=Hibiscus syriacus TaxID=106335 RepID=A0A6A2Y1C9_HIBSY|nr:hypothetical protein F3Y22_tig00112259pilonHSYRG00067 [Hibiscus syriacus]